jgi:hypothetical protein
MPEMINIILAKVPRAHTGLAAGMMNSTLQLGAAISVAAIGSVFFAALGDGAGARAYGHALAIAMAWVVMALGLSMLLGLRNERRLRSDA